MYHTNASVRARADVDSQSSVILLADNALIIRKSGEKGSSDLFGRIADDEIDNGPRGWAGFAREILLRVYLRVCCSLHKLHIGRSFGYTAPLSSAELRRRAIGPAEPFDGFIHAGFWIL